jgi:hypothetical protein
MSSTSRAGKKVDGCCKQATEFASRDNRPIWKDIRVIEKPASSIDAIEMPIS